MCYSLPILVLWVFTQVARHTIDDDTSTVRADDKILDQIVWRDYFQDIIEAESLMTLSKLILYLKTTCFIFSVEDAKRGTDFPLRAYCDKSSIFRVIMRNEDRALVAEGSVVAQVT